MTPSHLASEIDKSISEFLWTEFRPTISSFEKLIEEFLHKRKSILKGPYISLKLPFRQGKGGKNYFPDVPLAFPPHNHQELAFERLKSPNYKSTLIATGTESGKTESYMIPILDHCYQKRTTKGIKAILLYPMKTLVKDQAQQLTNLIWSNHKLKDNITAGLFLGESETEALRQNPPDILLTNDKMLDRLLMDPQNRQIWAKNTPETLRYLVVDEITWGNDLASLLKCLKAHLQTPPGYLACVGTYPTLGTDNAKKEMLESARTLFNEDFEPSALIEEDRLTSAEFLQPGDWEEWDLSPQTSKSNSQEQTKSFEELFEEGIKGLGKLFESWDLSLKILPSTPLPPDLEKLSPQELGKSLKSLPIIANLFEIFDAHQLISLEDLEIELAKKMSLPDDPELLTNLMALCAKVKTDQEKPWVDIGVQFCLTLSDADYVATFIPSDLEWLKDWGKLEKTGKISSGLIEIINQPMRWKVIPKIVSQSTQQSYSNKQEWLERANLLFEQDSLALLNYMQENHWRLPEIGYELTNKRGTVIAEAEFAWSNLKTALVLDESDLEPFQTQGWNVSTVAAILSEPKKFYETYLSK